MFWRNKNEGAIQILIQHANVLSDEALKRFEELKAITTSLDKGWEDQITSKTSDIIALASGRSAILKTISDLSNKKTKKPVIGGLRFQISSIFLRESWEYTTSDSARRERLLMITGPVTPEGTRILSRLVSVEFDKQSAGYVSVDINSSHNALVTLSETHSHELLAIFHSHISKGASSTTPSSIDIKNMERKLNDGIECLGGIFSLDGFVRFFSVGDDFSIDVYGKGVDLVETHPNSVVFKIADMG